MHRPGRLALLGLVVAAAMALTASSALAAEGHPYTGTSFGPDGVGGSTTFENVQGVAVDQTSGNVFAYDAGVGKVYKFDSTGAPVNFSALAGNAIEGAGGGFGGGVFEIAVAPAGSAGGTAGDIYVANNSVVKIYAPSGAPLGELTGGETCGVAVSPAGHVFVGVYPETIREYVPSANPPTNADETAASTASLPGICNVAADGLGNVYAANFEGAQGAVKLEGIGASSATQLDPSASTLAVDPTSNDVYADRGSVFAQYDSVGNLIGTSGSEQLSDSRGIAVDGATETVYAGNRGSGTVDDFGPAEPLKAAIVSESVVSVTATEAILQAEINPNGAATTYRFEYGVDSSYGQSTLEGSVGADEEKHQVSPSLDGLAPHTTYHWRVVATNSVGVAEGEDHTFHTFGLTAANEESCPNRVFRIGRSASLPDCRAYEMVSPVDKNNGDILSLVNITGFSTALQESALSGERFTYSSSRAFAEPNSAPLTSQYMATRGSGGWSTESLVPPRAGATINPFVVDNDFKAFSPDLCTAWMVVEADPPLAPGAEEGTRNVYQRSNCPASYETLAVGDPARLEMEAPDVQGYSADASKMVFAEGGEGGSPAYEVSGGIKKNLCVLPPGLSPTRESELQICRAGSPGHFFNQINRYGVTSHAVSNDGSRVYWSARNGDSANGFGSVFLRLNGETTLKVSETQTTASSRFWGASADGSKALFAVEGGSSSPLSQNFYEYDLDSEASSLIAGKFVGLAAASEDLSNIYFVSEEVLPGTTGATAGKQNLYLDHEGAYSFIATLSGQQAEAQSVNNVAAPPIYHAARANASGDQLAFVSTKSLTGYDNTDSNSGNADSEVYIYDADTGKLNCASCNPSGARPTGALGASVESEGGGWTAALLPLPTTQLYTPRVLSEDGSRLFFTAFDGLLPRDTNGKADVYEWVRPGSGSCEESSSAFSELNGGCIYLISSGESPSDSKLADISADGRDAFFLTNSSLLPQDPGLYDVYDARVDGGYPPPPNLPPNCEGEACQGPLALPNDPTPASSTFHGAGNVKEKPARKKHKKKAHKKKSKHAKKHAKRTNPNRRNAR